MPEQYNNQGALIDTRPEEKKLRDYTIKEAVASVAVVNWQEKPESSWRKFPDQNQDGSGSCVAQTTRKLAGILLWLKDGIFLALSATSIYQPRSTKPSSGMIGVEAFDIWKNQGISLEALIPSQNMNDAQMDAVKVPDYAKKVGEVFKIGGHLGIDNGDFETVASVIQQTGKGIMSWFYFTPEEWSRQIPVIIDKNLDCYAPSTARHSVADVEFTLVNGKKYIIIEDSAHFGGLTRRLISEEFFKARNFFNRYPMNFAFDDKTAPVVPEVIPAPKPLHTFVFPLEFIPNDPITGKVVDPLKDSRQKVDVVALQEILKYEGLFPTNVASTGYYGSMTAKAVLAFQRKYRVASEAELTKLKGEYVGEKTRAKLNELY